MKSSHEQHIITSWQQNADPWIHAIAHKEIESRKLITNEAIVNTILEKHPQNVLDIGCGEGWLARALDAQGIQVHGIDIVPDLVKAAERQGGGTFEVLSYQALGNGALNKTYDLLVCNFSLLGKASVEYVFRSITHLLNEDGFFIIQTIHPHSVKGNEQYEDGWREGSWAGFSDRFTDPPPWYFRTLDSWKELFREYHISLSDIREPIHPTHGTFASIIFIGEAEVEKENG